MSNGNDKYTQKQIADMPPMERDAMRRGGAFKGEGDTINLSKWLGERGLYALRQYNAGVVVICNKETNEEVARLTGTELSANQTPEDTLALIKQKLAL